MAVTPADERRDDNEQPPPGQRTTSGASKAVKAGWSIYQQIAAMFAAFGIAAMLSRLWDVGWKGFIQSLVAVWDATVRPAMEWVLRLLVAAPLSWFGIDLEVPSWARDYFAVGLILAFSMIRDYRARGGEAIGSGIAKRPYLVPLVPAAWPAVLVGLLYYVPMRRMNESMNRGGVTFGRVFRVLVLLVTLGGILIFAPFAVNAFLSAPRVVPGLSIFLCLGVLYSFMGLGFLRIAYLQTREPALKQAARSVGLVLAPLLYLGALVVVNALISYA